VSVSGSSLPFPSPDQPQHHTRAQRRESYTYHSSIIKNHIPRISQLSPNRRKPKHRIHALRIARDRRRLEVLHKLAHAHQLARQPELLLGRLEGRDGGLRVVGAVQVPC
jgi:hypothetical protein